MINNTTMEKALKKHEMIAPLLNLELDEAEKRRIRHEIMEREDISERTLRRYVAAYRDNRYEGLLPKDRCDKGSMKGMTEELLAMAMELKQELPERSLRRIIKILEGEGCCKVGELKRSTLSRHFNSIGLGAAEMRKSKSEGIAAKRFAKDGRNKLWQADLKYGPYIKMADGKKKKTYMLAFIDDATRLVCHAEFYDNQRLPVLEDSFRKAILKFGKPDAVYVDNGKIYVSRWFRVACAKLGIRHLNTKSYSPASKGKIERFNRTCEEFIQELSLEKAGSVDELNKKFRVWLDEGYNNQPHSSLIGGEERTHHKLDEKSPIQAFNSDPRKVRFATPEECQDAFLWEETRKVDKTGCFKLNGTEYEAGTKYIGKNIDIRYDPFNMGHVELWHSGELVKTVEPLKVGEFCGMIEKEMPTPTKKVTHSRLLKVYEQENSKRQKSKLGAISFRSMTGGATNV